VASQMERPFFLHRARQVSTRRSYARSSHPHCSLLLIAGLCYADVPTPEQECRIRNSALCEINGVQYLVEGPVLRQRRPSVTRPGALRRSVAGPATVGQSHSTVELQAVAGASPGSGLDRRIERWLIPALVLGAVRSSRPHDLAVRGPGCAATQATRCLARLARCSGRSSPQPAPYRRLTTRPGGVHANILQFRQSRYRSPYCSRPRGAGSISAVVAAVFAFLAWILGAIGRSAQDRPGRSVVMPRAGNPAELPGTAYGVCGSLARLGTTGDNRHSRIRLGNRINDLSLPWLSWHRNMPDYCTRPAR